MLISGARVALSASEAVTRDVWIRDGRVQFAPQTNRDEQVLNLAGYVILPGLINSHDHLELNLFPRLGRGPYANANAWARDIYRPKETPIKEQLSIPIGLRLEWGGIKNLLAGVTTVAHHNPPHPILSSATFPVRVVRSFGWAHSIHFSPDWKRRFDATPKNSPFLMHVAEGTDEGSRREIEVLQLDEALTPSTVLIHAVGLGSRELDWLKASRSSIVWCPSSNQFTLGATLPREARDSGIDVSLGSDSALTAAGDLLDELRFAENSTSAERLYRMVTSDAARILKLPVGFGEIRDGGPADLTFMEDAGLTPAETLCTALPAMVIVRGNIVLVAAKALRNLCSEVRPGERLGVEGRGCYAINYPVARLAEATHKYIPARLRLAGKEMVV